MSETKYSAVRFRRYNETLFALEAARQLHWNYLTKIQLQKLLYLTEMLAPFRDVIVSQLEYRFHHKGPYARDLQNGVDHLVTRGLVELAYYGLSPSSPDVPTADDQTEQASYRISPDGLSLIGELSTTTANRETRELVHAICELVGLYGLRNVVTIVYEEPTFAELKANGLKGHLISSDRENNQSTSLLQFLDAVGRERMKYRNLGWKVVFLAYFDYLWAQYVSRHPEAV